MASEHFVQLISNASLGVYPHNKISEFTTLLPQSLNLDGEWLVALHSCAYHRNWVNLTEGEDARVEIRLYEWRLNIYSAYSKVMMARGIVSIPHPGNYSTAESLIKSILGLSFIHKNEDTDLSISIKLGEVFDLEMNNATQKLQASWKKHATLNNSITEVDFSEKVCTMLGYLVQYPDAASFRKVVVGNPENIDTNIPTRYPLPPHTPSTIRDTYSFPFPLHLSDVFNLILYSDIASTTQLGDADAGYIYMIPVKGKEGDYVTITIDNLVYKKVNKQIVPSIHLKLADVNGERIKFNDGSGEFTALLHFVKIAS